MSSRLIRMWLMPFLLLGGQAMALGLGDIRLSSALNQPMRAEIALLSATPEELTNLTIQLATADTFDRYDLDRPGFLTGLDFDVVKSGRADGNFIRVTSAEPISEPFITFLVEASWSRGRLLREYTILLDPPTFAPPPAAQATQAVTAPSRATEADAGQIQRPGPAAAPQATSSARPAVQGPVQSPPVQAAPQNSGQNAGQPSFNTTPGGDLQVQRGETLWSIASRVRPDSRLTINQTMLAIYEANPQAFEGNINVMRAGASLRIPSADDVFNISRGDALVEVQRQNSAWTGEPALAPVDTQPSLTLVPPDEEDDIGLIDDTLDVGVDDAIEDTFVEDVDVDPVDARINEIQAILDDQDALLEIPDNELAALRAELATLRGEELPADPIDEIFADDVDDAQVDDVADDVVADDVVEDQVDTAPPAVVTTPVQEEGIVGTIMGYLQNFWVLVGGALLVTVGILFWFMRRSANRDEEAVTGVWEALDSDDFDAESTSTEQLSALARDDDESIVVVETQQTATLAEDDFLSDTLDTPAGMEPDRTVETQAPVMPAAAATGETGINKSIEDTFSSETAINLDQSDPIAEADFHMAYGLYDQAADLINGALSSDTANEGLLAKLCEIYFVWGNRDGFIDAAGRMREVAGGDANPDWDKIVIMWQQIAGDHEMFSGVSAEGATKAVDLSFEGGMDDGGALDIDFAGGPDGAVSDVIDLGADTGQDSIAPDGGDDIDFSFGEEEADIEASVTREMPPVGTDDGTAEMPAANDDLEPTTETPTVEQPFSADATGEMPGITEVETAIPEADATAEINLDDLGLDLGNLEETGVATDIADDDLIDDLEDTAKGQRLTMDAALDETGTDLNELVETAGQTGLQEALDVDEMLAATGEMPSLSEGTGEMPALGDDDATLLASLDDDGEDTDVGIDSSLLDATGQTQILTEDMVVETANDIGASLSDEDATMLASDYGDDDITEALPDDAATMLAPVAEETNEFDFAKTEALPKDVFSSDMSTDETGRMPELAGSTDLDLDLDDLTAALKVSEVGDTVNQMRDDATV
ncbi:MAG: type IV pilus assembly protein FimV, partial [Woeseiaceae bacterium]